MVKETKKTDKDVKAKGDKKKKPKGPITQRFGLGEEKKAVYKFFPIDANDVALEEGITSPIYLPKDVFNNTLPDVIVVTFTVEE